MTEINLIFVRSRQVWQYFFKKQDFNLKYWVVTFSFLRYCGQFTVWRNEGGVQLPRGRGDNE